MPFTIIHCRLTSEIKHNIQYWARPTMNFINIKAGRIQPLKYVIFLKIFVEPEALKDGFSDNIEWMKYTNNTKQQTTLEK